MDNSIIPPELPEMPDISAMKERAIARKRFFLERRAEIDIEIKKCDDFLAMFGVGKKSRSRTVHSRMNMSDKVFNYVLCALAKHNFAGVSTLANGVSDTTVRYAMQRANNEGLANIERRGRKLRYSLTEKGRGYVSTIACQEVSN